MSVEGLKGIPPSEYGNSVSVQGERNIRKRNNEMLCTYLGNPTRIRYGAGRWDMEVSTLPSVEVVAIVDRVPLLFSEVKPNNKYSAQIHAHLEENNGSYITLPELFAGPHFLPAQQYEFMDMVKENYSYYREYVSMKYGSELGVDTVIDDSLPVVLAGILYWGGDVDTTRIGKFGDSFRVQFDLENKRKTLIFKEAHIDESFNQVGSDNYLWWQSCLDDFAPGTTALLVKADVNCVSRHLMGVQPDVVAGNGWDFDDFVKTLGDRYDFTQIDSFEFPDGDQGWGYRKLNNIQIGKRLPATSFA